MDDETLKNFRCESLTASARHQSIRATLWRAPTPRTPAAECPPLATCSQTFVKASVEGAAFLRASVLTLRSRKNFSAMTWSCDSWCRLNLCGLRCAFFLKPNFANCPVARQERASSSFNRPRRCSRVISEHSRQPAPHRC